MIYINLTTVRVRNKKDEDEMRKAMLQLFDFDEDMNGNNGPDFLWPEAEEAECSSNNEYLAEEVYAASNASSAKDKFELFAEKFFEANNSYYRAYEIDFIEDGNELIVSFAIAYK